MRVSLNAWWLDDWMCRVHWMDMQRSGYCQLLQQTAHHMVSVGFV